MNQRVLMILMGIACGAAPGFCLADKDDVDRVVFTNTVAIT